MLEIFSVGGGEEIVNVLNAVAAWAGGGGYRALLRVVMLIGFGYVLVTLVWDADPRAMIKWFIQAVVMYSCLMVPTIDVRVVDRTNPNIAPATVSNVPLGLGLAASFTSQVGDYLTRAAETVFVMPASLGYSSNGLIYGARLLEATQALRIDDPVFAANLQEHYQRCVFYDVLLGRKTYEQIAKAPDLLAAMAPGSVSLAQTWVDSAGGSSVVSCRQAYQTLQTDWGQYYTASQARIAKQFFPMLNAGDASARLSDVGTVGTQALGSGVTSQQLVRQAMFVNALMQARDAFGNSSAQSVADAFATTRADVQTRKTYSTLASGAMKWVPLLNVVLTVVFYAMFPVVFLLMLMPNTGAATARGYLMGFFYLASWGPLFAVLNMMFMLRWGSSMEGWAAGGLTAWNFDPIVGINQDIAALAGYMIMSVPFIAAGMARGAMAIASHSTSYLAPSQNAAEQAAAEATTGNYAYGNVSLANRTINTAQLDQINTAPSVTSGSGLYSVRNADGGLVSNSGDGSLIYNSAPGISALPYALDYSKRYTSEAREALSQGQGVVEQKRETASQSWAATATRGSQLFETAQRSASSGTDEGRAVQYSLGRTQEASDALSTNLQSRFGLDRTSADSMARQAVMQGGLSASVAPSAFGIGGGASGTASSQAARTWDSKTATNQSLSEALDYANRFASSQQAREARESFMRATSSTSDQELSGLSEQYNASLAESRQRTLDASRTEDNFQRYSQDLSNSALRDYRLTENEAQDLVNFMHGEMEQNPVLAASGFVPGKVVLTPQQEQVRDALIGKFMEARLDTMRQDLGLRPAHELDEPASTTTAQISSWHDANSAGLALRAPRIDVEGSQRNTALETRVAGDIDAGFARVQLDGAHMRSAADIGHRDADRQRSSVGDAHHATLGQTMPVVGNLIGGVPRRASIDGADMARQQGLGIKPGARLNTMSPLIAPSLEAVSRSSRDLGLPTGVVTSGSDGRHKDGSLHYQGKALDFRGNNISIGQGLALERRVQRQLGSDYDVKFEVFPDKPENNHLHVEHDPKPPRRK